MLKTLLKKQMLEFFSGILVNSRNNKTSSEIKKGLVFLFSVLMLVFPLIFLGVARLLSPLLNSGFEWLYFSVFCMLATLMGIIGSVFTTYNTLYDAKDNDLLFSMPIPTKIIFVARLSGIYIAALIYEAFVFVPSVVIYFLNCGFDISVLISSLLCVVLLPLAAVSVSCVFGWIIALFISKIRNKGIVSVVSSILFFALYYSVSLKFNSIVNLIITNAGEIGEFIKKYLYPIYLAGNACCGNLFSLIIFSGMIILVFVAIYFIISSEFLRLATAKHGLKKRIYSEKKVVSLPVRVTLLKKELLYFKSSPVYMLNSALGSVLLIVFAVIVAIKGRELPGYFYAAGFSEKSIPVIMCMVSCFAASTNNITSSSISLEAGSLWLIKSVPVNIRIIFFAKVMLHMIITWIPSFICNIIIAVRFDADPILGAMLIIFSFLFVLLCALSGLEINLMLPKLDWTNEAVPVKQSLAATAGMLIGMVYLIIIIVLYFALSTFVSSELILLVFILILTAACLILKINIGKNGVERFTKL